MEKIRLRAKTAFLLPDGSKVAAGAEIDLSRRQAKYLLIGGKAEQVSAPTPEAEIAETGVERVAEESPKSAGSKGVKK